MNEQEKRALRILGELGHWASPDAPPSPQPPALRHRTADDPGAQLDRAIRLAVENGVVPSTDQSKTLRRLLARRSGWRIPSWPIAAALVLSISMIGTAAGVLWRAAPTLLGTGNSQRVSDITNPPPDIPAAGVPEGAVRRAGVRFLWRDGRQTGNVIALSLPAGKGIELCGFAPNGKPLWRARGTAAWWPELLGVPRLRVHQLACLITRRGAPGGDEQTVVLVAYAHGQTLVLLIDPTTGNKRGRFVFDGQLAVHREGSEALAPLPSASGVERNLILLGSHGRGLLAVPAALIFRTDGTVTQQIRLPSIGYQHPGADFAERMTSVWSKDRAEVVIESMDGVQFYLLVEAGRVLLQDVLVRLNDDARKNYNRAHKSDTAWNAFVESKGGIGKYVRELAAGIRGAGQEGVTPTWRAR